MLRLVWELFFVLDSVLQEKMCFLLNFTAGLGIQHGIAHLGYGALWIEAKYILTGAVPVGQKMGSSLTLSQTALFSCPIPYPTPLGQIEPRQKDDI